VVKNRQPAGSELHTEGALKLKDGRWMGASRDSVTSNNFSECILVTLKPTNVFLCGAKKQGIGVVKPGAH